MLTRQQHLGLALAHFGALMIPSNVVFYDFPAENGSYTPTVWASVVWQTAGWETPDVFARDLEKLVEE